MIRLLTKHKKYSHLSDEITSDPDDGGRDGPWNVGNL
jgi:hypothetical protein